MTITVDETNTRVGFTMEEVEASRFEEVNLLAVIDTDPYQKPIKNRVKELIENFDPSALGVLIVNRRRDGSLHMIDGKHRKAACLHHGKTVATAQVFQYLTYEREAQLRRFYNNKIKDTTLEKYNLDLAARMAYAVDIDKILTNEGFIITNGRHGNPMSISAIGAIVYTYTRYRDGAQQLRNVLRVMKSSWGHGKEQFNADLIQGVSTFLAVHRDAVDLDYAIHKFKKYTPSYFTRVGGMGRRSSAVAMALLEAYNKHKKVQDRLESKIKP